MTHKPKPPHPVQGDAAAAVKASNTAIRSRQAFTVTPHKTQGHDKRRQAVAVSDGRLAAGVVVPVGSSRWRAIDHQGRGCGIFKTLKQAIRALPKRTEGDA
jgi:hypothetical protein